MNDVPETDAWERRVALTEANGRRVNEAIERGHREDDHAAFVCECGLIGCSTVLSVTLADYERVRSHFDQFLVSPGHEIGEIEEVVVTEEGYVVVRKTGEGADVAAETDPRDGGDGG